MKNQFPRLNNFLKEKSWDIQRGLFNTRYIVIAGNCEQIKRKGEKVRISKVDNINREQSESRPVLKTD